MTCPLFRNEQERISEENRRWDYQVNIQLRWVREMLHYADNIKINAPDCKCNIDGDSDGLAATDQEIPTGSAASLSTDYESGDIDCHLHSQTDWQLKI